MLPIHLKLANDDNHSYLAKLLWDFTSTLITDRPLRPDITFVSKCHKEVFLIDVAIPGDSRLSHKIVEQQDKYLIFQHRLFTLFKDLCYTALQHYFGDI